MFDKEKFISNLLQLRQKQGLSQAQMGEAIGLSKQGVNEIEKGRNKITLERATLLAEFFNVPLDYLVGRTDDCGKSNLPSCTALYDDVYFHYPQMSARISESCSTLGPETCIELLGIAENEYQLIIDGKQPLTLQQLLRLAERLAFSVDYLVGFTNEPKPYFPDYEFAYDQIGALPPDERELLRTYRQLTGFNKGRLLERSRILNEDQACVVPEAINAKR